MSVIQRIARKEPSSLEVAQRYFSVISCMNDLSLTKREVQLLAFMATRGNINYANNREEFCRMYSSSGPSINNMLSKLKRQGVVVKEGRRMRVHPLLSLDFTKDVLLGVRLEVKKGEYVVETNVHVGEGLPDKGDVQKPDDE